MAKKPDLSAVKDFLFNHGEKVALGVCAFIAIVLGGLKLWDAAGAGYASNGKPWKLAFDEAKNGVQTKLAGNLPVPVIKEDDMDPEKYKWRFRPTDYQQAKYMEVPEVKDTLRRNPAAMTIVNDPAKIRLDYVRGLIFTHEIDELNHTVQGMESPTGAVGPMGQPMPVPMPMPGGPRGKKGLAGKDPVILPERLKKGQPSKFIVVHAVFPMKKQVEEFAAAFKLLSQKELFDNREDLPRIVGINVVRFELDRPGGQAVGKPEVIINQGPNGLQVQKALEKMLRESMYDESCAEAFASYIFAGLTMPLPKLAYGEYPRFKFDGWDVTWPDDAAPKDGPDIMKKQPMQKQPMGNFPMLPGDKKRPPMIPVNPMNPMGNQPGMANDGQENVKKIPITEKELKAGDLALYNRLFGKNLAKDFNPFHVLGQFVPPEEAKNAVPGANPMMVRPNPMPVGMDGMGKNGSTYQYFNAWDIDPPMAEMPEQPEGPAPKGPRGKPPVPMPGFEMPGGINAPFAPWERDALVRFIDADVKPGKTYSYAIQVRLANPNYKQDTKVQAAFMAAVAELTDAWVTTPSITIPYDYFLYAVDQKQLDEWMKDVKKSDIKLPKEATPFQVHQWADELRDEGTNQKYQIGDWAIAGRQIVHKGDHIGVVAQIPVPVWNKDKQAFDINTVKGNKKKGEPDKLGVKVRLKPESEAPILVDFSGGRRMRPNNIGVEEETAVDALILTPDGKLRLQNSRDDAAAVQAEAYVQGQPPRGVSRQDRWLALQRRVIELQSLAMPQDTGGPGTGGPPNIKLPGVRGN